MRGNIYNEYIRIADIPKLGESHNKEGLICQNRL